MKRLLVIWVLVLNLALGHNVTYHALQSIKLCLDNDSVQVTVNVQGEKIQGEKIQGEKIQGEKIQGEKIQGEKSNDEYVKIIKDRLQNNLRSTLKNYQVPFETKPSCKGSKGFILSIFSTAWSDKGSNEPYYVLVASTQVGDKPPQDIPFTADMVLGGNVFDGFVSNLLLESDFSEPFEEVFPRSNEDGYKDLAEAWWLDNPNGLSQIAFLPQRIGAGIVAFILLAGLIFMLLKQRKTKSGKTVLP
jgi:hypothetical protein